MVIKNPTFPSFFGRFLLAKTSKERKKFNALWHRTHFRFGAPEPTRTVDPQLRRLLLYPAELRAQRFNNIRLF